MVYTPNAFVPAEAFPLSPGRRSCGARPGFPPLGRAFAQTAISLNSCSVETWSFEATLGLRNSRFLQNMSLEGYGSHTQNQQRRNKNGEQEGLVDQVDRQGAISQPAEQRHGPELR